MSIDRKSGPDQQGSSESSGSSVAPGKRSRTGSLQRMTVQRDGESGAPSDPAVVMPAAERGVSGGGGEIPFRNQMENGFGVSFDDVRAHTGGNAAEASSAIGAQAYTMGPDIAFGTTPTPSLVAHELAHVVQQDAGVGPAGGVGSAGDSFEREADEAASTVASGGVSDLAERHGNTGGRLGGALQRKVVQRYESGEHAIMGGNASYPAGDGDLVLDSGAAIHMGEMVAFGDFYADLKQLQAAPRQEVESLAGICRLEAVWVRARMAKAKADKNSVTSQVAPGASGGAAAPGSTAGGNAPGAAPAATPAAAPGGPSAKRLENMPKHIAGDDPIWTDDGSKLLNLRTAIFQQFKPSWDFYGIVLPETTQPETGMAMVKATVGRRRFRGENNAMVGPNDPNAKNEPNKGATDPGKLGGDYLDLAQNNLSHFTPDNWHNWKTMHDEACKAHAAATDDKAKKMALATDMMGGHFLTDRFSSGHFVDKAELMAYATTMMVDTAKKAGKKGANANEILKSELLAAVSACFEDGNVVDKWKAGVETAAKEGVIGPSEATLLAVLPAGTLAGKLVDVIMDMPWRKFDPGATPESSPDSRTYGPNSENRKTAAPAPAGATGEASKGGDYHLGAGNLAALQVHDALNAMGFTVKNKTTQWRLQGDDHLNAETIAVSQQALAKSQAQVVGGTSNESEIKDLMPTEAMMDPAWIMDFFKGEWAQAQFDQARISSLMAYVNGKKIAISTEAGSKGVGPEMTSICHQIMQIMFLAPTGAPAGADAGTGLNISMLKAFLVDRLEEMVPFAYLSTSAADIPQAALELYAPKGAEGKSLPRSANDFVWNGNRLNFNVNATGCEGGTYRMKAKVYNRDNGYDTDARGQPYGRGNADQSGGNVGGMGGAFDGSTNGGGLEIGWGITIPSRNSDEPLPDVDFEIAVPVQPAQTPGGGPQIIVPTTINIPKQGFWSDDGDRYVVVSGDPGGQCSIGRSNVASDGSLAGNPSTMIEPPQVTGKDAKKPIKPLEVIGLKDGAINWDENSVLFALEVKEKAEKDTTVTVYVRSMNWDLIGADKKIGSPQAVQAKVLEGYDYSRIIVFTPPEDNWNDTYVQIFSDPACANKIGESRSQGHDKGGPVKNLAGRNPAKSVSHFQWNGDNLVFRVEPEDADEVYVKFFDEDWGNDYNADGTPKGGAKNTDPQLGGIRTAKVNNGAGSVTGPDDGDAYGIVFSDAGCTAPLARSGTKS